MPATVNVYFADHDFDRQGNRLGEIKPFLEHLLDKAGYTGTHRWDARIDKQLHCDSKTQPIRLRNWKPQCVVLRCKPTQHATYDYIISLHMPDGAGYSAEKVLAQLNNAVKSANRAILDDKYRRAGVSAPAPVPLPEPAPARPASLATVIPPAIAERMTLAVPPAPNEEEVEEDWPVFLNLQGILRDEKKLRYALAIVHRLSRSNKAWRNLAYYKHTFQTEARWDDHQSLASSRVLNSLEKEGYIEPVHGDGAGNPIRYFQLTENGRLKLGDYKLPDEIEKRKEGKPQTPPPAKPDLGKLLMTFASEKGRDIMGIAKAMRSNRMAFAEQEEIKRNAEEEMQRLQREYERLEAHLEDNPEAVKLLAQAAAAYSVMPGLSTEGEVVDAEAELETVRA